MQTIYLNYPVESASFDFLQENFPRQLFLTGELSDSQAAKVDIVVSESLVPKFLNRVESLKWLHLINTSISLKEWEGLTRKPQILSSSRTDNKQEFVELILGGTLAIGHQFNFCKMEGEPWQLNKAKILVVGLKDFGSDLARAFHALGCEVKGVDKHETFHPHCTKVYSMDKLHSLLPAANLVCICPHACLLNEGWFGKKELALLPKGAILAVGGNPHALDLAAVKKELIADRLFGMTVVPYTSKGSKELALFPKTLVLTPQNQRLPTAQEALKIFRYNLRRLLLSRKEEMVHVVA